MVLSNFRISETNQKVGGIWVSSVGLCSFIRIGINSNNVVTTYKINNFFMEGDTRRSLCWSSKLVMGVKRSW